MSDAPPGTPAADDFKVIAEKLKEIETERAKERESRRDDGQNLETG